VATAGQQTKPGGYLLHLNSRRWTTGRLPSSINYAVDGIVPDGHGGIWLDALLRGKGASLLTGIYHYGAGRWTTSHLPVPAGYAIAGINALGRRCAWRHVKAS
jgi:hypothetical protein